MQKSQHKYDYYSQKLLINPALTDRILSLDPEHITEKDIQEVLSKSPAPRIINLNGSLPLISMDSFSRFLIRMGYPEKQIRNPVNGHYSYSSYRSSKQFAGLVAWYHEKEGMMPILIGHSQGGMKVIKTLYEFSGEFHDKIPVWNPITEKAEERYTIIDPLTGAERDVVGLKVGYASAIRNWQIHEVCSGSMEYVKQIKKNP